MNRIGNKRRCLPVMQALVAKSRGILRLWRGKPRRQGAGPEGSPCPLWKAPSPPQEGGGSSSSAYRRQAKAAPPSPGIRSGRRPGSWFAKGNTGEPGSQPRWQMGWQPPTTGCTADRAPSAPSKGCGNVGVSACPGSWFLRPAGKPGRWAVTLRGRRYNR